MNVVDETDDTRDEQETGGLGAPGPDERDRDLMDGSWEARYYGGHIRERDWSSIIIGVSLLLLMAFTLPIILMFR
jgi:hypothetical protein